MPADQSRNRGMPINVVLVGMSRAGFKVLLFGWFEGPGVLEELVLGALKRALLGCGWFGVRARLGSDTRQVSG